MERKILHLDLDAFFCAVEELLDPSLKGKAFAVGGSPNSRGVVSSCSYPARLRGVHSAMPMGRALELCPDLIVVHHRFGVYGETSDKVMDILRDYTPLFQQVSVDEAFLDVSDLPQPIGAIARDMQQRIEHELHLPCSIGAATNKLVAKVANDYGKSRIRTGQAPRQITVVPPGTEADFLAPLDVQALWGIGPKTAQRLHSRGIHTIGQLAELPLAELEHFFGKNAAEVQESARGIDRSPVHSSREVKSVSNEVTFSRDTSDMEQLVGTLRRLSDKVGYRMRQARLMGSVVQIKLRYADFTTLTRQRALPNPTNLDDEILVAAEKLLQETLNPDREVRLIGWGSANYRSPISSWLCGTIPAARKSSWLSRLTRSRTSMAITLSSAAAR
jgi:Nucleotidyltransferase/DNA polymerase involved in DNA repair